MPVLAYIEKQNVSFNKKSFELVTYAKKSAKELGEECIALVINSADAEVLGKYGADRVLNIENNKLGSFDANQYAEVICEVAANNDANHLILHHNANGKSLLGMIAAKWDCASVSAASTLPTMDDNGFYLKKPVFSGKAYATYKLESARKVWSVAGNTIPPEEIGNEVKVEPVQMDVSEARVEVISVDKITGKTPLPEAELVVSGGRGFKGAENWHILEDLANQLNAATACSRPVADSEWRPHHEHVGQTGIAIRPNLYIAIGISGAIQHLAGVNNSKVIVVINKDPEAPFFKAADYGVVGDLFDVVPRLTEAIKKYKESGTN